MNNFYQRLITGFILVSLFIIFVLIGEISFFILVLLIGTLGLLEFYRLFESVGIHSRKFLGTLFSISILTLSALTAAAITKAAVLLFMIPLTFIIFLFELYSTSAKPFLNLAFTFLGVFYVTIPSAFLILIAYFPFDGGIYHPYRILGYFFIVWSHDSGAYGFGKLFGKHPLFKRISPGKTWEGSIGGVFSVCLMSYILSHFYNELNLDGWLITGLIVTVVGTYGDLIKSMLKRSINVKDSGNILPGHGGMLDRFDAMLSAAPFVFIYIYLAS